LALARLAGLVLLLFGIAVGALTGVGIERQLVYSGTIERSAVILLSVLVVVSAFCTFVGYRLVFNRPNRYGSLLSPNAWIVLAGVFATVGLLFTVLFFSHKLGVSGFLAAAASSFAFAVMCWRARAAAMIHPESPGPPYEPL
jgi:O-antigen/teichoic acid export membrane protein